ncbi:MAG: hypothetical protein AAF703_12235 [Cyanobacteria bacterium P01_D01_bin.105]
MPAKQKITLYISDDLHRQFKIRSAIDGETMSSIAQRAIEFYLAHPEAVEGSDDVHGQTHRIHACPKCAAPVALRDDKLALISDQSEQSFEALTKLSRMSELGRESLSPDEGELIGCP